MRRSIGFEIQEGGKDAHGQVELEAAFFRNDNEFFFPLWAKLKLHSGTFQCLPADLNLDEFAVKRQTLPNSRG